MIPSLPAAFDIYQIGVVVAGLEAGMASYGALLGLSGWKRMDTDYIGRYHDWEAGLPIATPLHPGARSISK